MDCLLRVLYGLSIGGPKQTVYEGYLTVWTVCERVFNGLSFEVPLWTVYQGSLNRLSMKGT